MNLIANVFYKYGKRGVKVMKAIKVERLNLIDPTKYSEGDLDIRLLENGTIIFANTAPKLNKAETAKLFDRFYTVETARNSTGLGLSIAKSLVEKMHGTIGADYVNGKLEIQVEFDCQNGVYME